MRNGFGAWKWAIRMLGFNSKEKRARQKHIISAVLVVTLSVIPLIIAIFLVNGMTYGITKKYINLSSYHAQVRTDTGREDLTNLSQLLSESPMIDSAYLTAETYSIIYSEQESHSTMIKGVETDYLSSQAFREQVKVVSGSLELSGESNRSQLVLSSTIAEKLQVDTGDSVAVVSVSYREGNSRIRPAMFRIAAVVESGYTQLDQQLAYMPIEDYQRFLHAWADTAFVGVLFTDEAGEHIDYMHAVLREYDEIRQITTWDQLNAAVYHNFRTSKTILYLIMVLIIFIAAVNIAATCILLVQEKYIDIGLLKSLGIPLSTINSAFVIASLLIGAVGALLGVGIGVVLSTQINHLFGLMQNLNIAALDFYLVDIPIIFNASEIIAVFVTTIVFSGLVSAIPLRRIRTIVPIHLLQE